MYTTVNLCDFRTAFANLRPNNFTYEGLEVLFDYLTELEHCSEPYELDVIALCCDFSEGTPQEIANDYSIDIDGLEDDDAFEAVKAYLDDEGVLVGETDTTIVYRSF